MRRWAAGALLLAAAACAQAGRPPGGEIDQLPPRVIAVSPAAFDTLRDLTRPVVIRFDERISERLEGVTDVRDAVLVSPETGVVRVERNRRSLEVSLDGGWRPGLVYRVVVLPVFRDLFQNVRLEPIELVFSTGAPIQENAVAGFVTDRLTGRPVQGARVRATRDPDSTAYVAVSDTAGFFSIRYLPAGSYRLRGWQDQDRDGTVDFFEAADVGGAELAAGDTAVLELRLLPGDSTPARLARAEPLDTVTLRLLFDDYFPPGPVDGAGVVFRAGDSTRVAAGRLLHGSRLDSLRAARAAALDTAGADTARVAPGDTLPAPAPARREAGRQGPPRVPLPSRELLLLLPAGLTPDSSYYVVAEGLTNIGGIPGGGGSAPFEMPPPAPDTAGVPADSLPAPPDTTAGGRPGGRNGRR